MLRSFQALGAPAVTFTASVGNRATGMYAAPCAAWQSSQWQKNWATGSPVSSMCTAPHRHWISVIAPRFLYFVPRRPRSSPSISASSPSWKPTCANRTTPSLSMRKDEGIVSGLYRRATDLSPSHASGNVAP
jgi:hypothetical protein